VDYLSRTLDALEVQTLSKDKWELILVDNASKDFLSEKWNLTMHPHAKHIREDNIGLTYARIRSIQEANGEVLVFVDDDNVLAANYLEQAAKVAIEWKMLGAWGGQQFPEFEDGAPEELWKRDFWTGRLDRDIWSNNYDRDAAPCGSGLCVRKVVADQYVKLVKSAGLRSSLGRSGEGLNAAEDIDLDYVACDMNLGIARLRLLSLVHLIPAKRLTDDYLYKLCEGFGYSETVLLALRGNYPIRPSRVDRIVSRYKSLRAKCKPSLEDAARREGRERALKALELYELK
jgi:glycosyltransferase involved in cell wall biosynthesis